MKACAARKIKKSDDNFFCLIANIWEDHITFYAHILSLRLSLYQQFTLIKNDFIKGHLGCIIAKPYIYLNIPLFPLITFIHQITKYINEKP